MAQISLNKFVAVLIALGMFYIIASTLVLPFFTDTYSYCQHLEWKGAAANVTTNCTDPIETGTFNTSFLDCTHPTDTICATYTQDGQSNPIDTNATNTSHYCLNCDTRGGYGTPMRGLALLILVLAFVGVGVYMMPKRRL